MTARIMPDHNKIIMPCEMDHSHVFLGAAHDSNARRTRTVIWLCAVTMLAEIIGGNIFGSLAVVADGIHMSTHAGALTVTAIAYGYAKRHADDPRFTFGTGKLGDLVGFSSAVVLMLFALTIAYEAVERLISPIAIEFDEAIGLAIGGLIVNLISIWLLGQGGKHQHEGHDHGHGAAHRDNNIRAVYIHILTDAAVSILALGGLFMGRFFGWVWMDPLMGLAGAVIIARWSFGLARDTGAILLDMTSDPGLAAEIRGALERDGDRVVDLHLWRLGPGHLGTIVSVVTAHPRDVEFYRERLRDFRSLSHITIEVREQSGFTHDVAVSSGQSSVSR